MPAVELLNVDDYERCRLYLGRDKHSRKVERAMALVQTVDEIEYQEQMEGTSRE